MELTINNLIKIIIAVLVIFFFISAAYLSVTNYIIPYFSGMNFTDDDGGIGSKNICEGKTPYGYLQKEGDKLYYYDRNGEKTDYYFIEKDNYFQFKEKKIGSDEEIGRINGVELEIYNDYLKYFKDLDGVYIGGKQVCK